MITAIVFTTTGVTETAFAKVSIAMIIDSVSRIVEVAGVTAAHTRKHSKAHCFIFMEIVNKCCIIKLFVSKNLIFFTTKKFKILPHKIVRKIYF